MLRGHLPLQVWQGDSDLLRYNFNKVNARDTGLYSIHSAGNTITLKGAAFITNNVSLGAGGDRGEVYYYDGSPGNYAQVRHILTFQKYLKPSRNI